MTIGHAPSFPIMWNEELERDLRASEAAIDRFAEECQRKQDERLAGNEAQRTEKRNGTPNL